MLQGIAPQLLRNRLVLLHHFSDLFCPCISMFDLEGSGDDLSTPPSTAGAAGRGGSRGAGKPDMLRGVLVSSTKVGMEIVIIIVLGLGSVWLWKDVTKD